MFLSGYSAQLSGCVYWSLMKPSESWCQDGMHLTGAPCSRGEEGLQLGVTHFPFLKLHCGVLDFQQEDVVAFLSF